MICSNRLEQINSLNNLINEREVRESNPTASGVQDNHDARSGRAPGKPAAPRQRCYPAFSCCVHTSLCFEISGLPDKLSAWGGEHFLEKACDRTVQHPVQLPLRGILFKLSLISLKIQNCKKTPSSVGVFCNTIDT